ncbi:type II toxin-antitoxin system Phd/YefM family antitoxin [Nocardia puris]|uniref:Antitoxin n=1 Tax=Nocardia puris TaxID=208602 RepID=A0A366DQL4_9NOCA|nr:type II toxin-antitoxin system Phd/YefM family antitoxin [Nocardia puris]MBF6213537.1 type II toxin-antitoxin system Phd/YefM family antitoxin [Nocardia puris]MBF6365533.1 type II toxin-antitoxin system Phd/YefM family antitoxin [Nocardia puris]MBF6459999.1 type II toxin-antitoxin system Phd/YefM family antitoxin [Nocardia puris]RBO91518.1 prevent-host-death family protein [Nocardia puris]
MSEISIRELRANLATHVKEAESGEQVIILRDGVPAAALVPLSVVEAFDAAEDELLAREAVARLEEGGPTFTMAEVLADLFAEDDE